MDSNLASHQVAGTVINPAALSFVLHNDEPRHVRITSPQQLLFPSSPRSVCEELGLNWWAAIKLYEEGWLSFCPESTPRLDEAQEAELRFVGALVLAGCDRRMLITLLSGLSKPYAYHSHKMYYDWSARRWRTVSDFHEQPEAVFTDWLEKMVEHRDAVSLKGVLELAHDALARARRDTEPPPPA
jgi:hypothetical protein